MTATEAADLLDVMRLKLELKPARVRGPSAETAPTMARLRWKCEALALAVVELRKARAP